MRAEEKIIKAMQKIQTVKDVYMRSVKKQTGNMLKLNEKQLDEGILNTGQLISPQYKDSYAKRKKRTIPDLKLTGDYRNSLFIDIKNDGLKFGASDFKDSFLSKRYTEDIKGLTKENSSEAFLKVLILVDKVINDATKNI